MSENWLQSAGKWLTKPFWILLHPWLEKQAKSYAESTEVREKLLRQLIRFRLRDCVQRKLVDSVGADGLHERVFRRLSPELIESRSLVDLTNDEAAKLIEKEVELHVIERKDWYMLACLARLKEFAPKMYVKIQSVDKSGSQHHSSQLTSVIQQRFPFTNVLILKNANLASISEDALVLLKEYCARESLPKLVFESSSDPGSFEMQLENGTIINQGWTPD